MLCSKENAKGKLHKNWKAKPEGGFSRFADKMQSGSVSLHMAIGNLEDYICIRDVTDACKLLGSQHKRPAIPPLQKPSYGANLGPLSIDFVSHVLRHGILCTNACTSQSHSHWVLQVVPYTVHMKLTVGGSVVREHIPSG